MRDNVYIGDLVELGFGIEDEGVGREFLVATVVVVAFH
jgi:hypothetical protein